MFAKKLQRKSDRLLCIFDDGTISLENVLETDGEVLETSERCLNLSELDKFVDVSGCVFYATKLDISAKSESENLKKLRRDVTIKNIFNYDKGKNVDIMMFVPWILLALAIVMR